MSNKGFVPIEEIHNGSTWMAADGSSYGLVVVGRDLKTGDVLVRPFGMPDMFKKPTRIDWFKLQYRYEQAQSSRKRRK